MLIFARTGRDTITLNVEPSNTILELKFIIRKRERRMLNLFFAGKPLNDLRTLSDYGI
jgi:hypothetical protein